MTEPGAVGRLARAIMLVADCWASSRASIDSKMSVGVSGRTRVGVDHRVRVAVADHLEVDVVGRRAAGHHRVELLARLGAGGQAVHGVRGDALGGVHGAGVAELGGLLDVLGREVDGAAVA